MPRESMLLSGKISTAGAIGMTGPRTEGKTALPNPYCPRASRGQNQPSVIESQALYRALRPRREIRCRHRGQPTRRAAGIPARDRLVVALCGRTCAQDFPRKIDGRIDLVCGGQPGSWSRSGASHSQRRRRRSRVGAGLLRGGPRPGIGDRRHVGRNPATSPRPDRARGRTCRGRALGAAPRRTRTPGQPAAKPSCAAGPRPSAAMRRPCTF